MGNNKWPLRSLAEVCDSIDYGYTASAIESPVGPKFLRITDIVQGHIDWDSVPYCELNDKEYQKNKLNEGDIVIARTGATTGVSQYISSPPDAVFASYLVRFKIGDEAEPRYVSYCLKSKEYWSYIKGVLGDKSAQPNASAKTISLAKIPIPPKDIQQSIAHILGNLDDKIELNRKMNETLEEMARAIFKSWFIDFDPVRAKAEGRQPYGMNAETAALFPNSFEESPIGLLPQGWKVSTLDEEITIKGGSTPSTKKPEYWEEGVHHWATPRDLSKLASPILLDTERKITDEGIASISSGQMPPGTLLISSRAPVGYLAISAVPISVNQGFIAMLCDRDLSNYFMLNWCHFNMDMIKSHAGGTTFQEISKRNFRPLQLIKPTGTVLIAFDNFIDPFFKIIRSNEKESNVLISVRDSLLPKLLSGGISVSDSDTALRLRPFHEAVIFVDFVRRAKERGRLPTRLEIQKKAYFTLRRLGYSVTTLFDKYAAGPYRPDARYRGGESIALKKKYIIARGTNQFELGTNFHEILNYLPRFEEAIDWVDKYLGDTKDKILELMATVDYAAIELGSKGKALSPEAIMEYISSTQEWRGKLDKKTFTLGKIKTSLKSLSGRFVIPYRDRLISEA